MSVFSFANGGQLRQDELEELTTLVKIREPDRLDELPDNYQVITADMLNYKSSQEGSMDDQGYYHAGFPALGGQSIAVLQDDGTISISFRGTNDGLDLNSIYAFPNNAYIYGFDEWLGAVANFAEANNYTIDFVTGKSLGGAATNMLRDESDVIANGAYENVTYFGVASPLIADNSDNIVNFGYQNDYAFEWYEERFGDGDVDRASVTDNIVFYNQDYADANWTATLDFSAHAYNAFLTGIERLSTQTQWDLQQDDAIIISDVSQVKVNLALNRMDTDADDVYVFATDKMNHKIYGADTNDHISLGNGRDVVRSGKGDDEIYIGGGRDTVYSGSGNDKIFDEYGADKIFAGSGNDIIYSGGGGDLVRGGSGNDRIDAGFGNDNVNGGSGEDQIFGDQGNDRLYGSGGNDEIYGGLGNDLLRGGSGNDIVFGNEGNDNIYGDKGNDILNGGAGDDMLRGGRGTDQFVYDGQGNDVIYDFDLKTEKIQLSQEFQDQIGTNSLKDYVEENEDGQVIFRIDDENSLLLKRHSLEDLEALENDDDVEDWADVVFA